MIIHAFVQDKFHVNLVSIGDLVLASEIIEENKGKSSRKYYVSKRIPMTVEESNRVFKYLKECQLR